MDKLEKSLARANAAQRRASDQMERRAKQSADKLRDTYGKAGDGITASFRKLGALRGGGLVGLIGGATVAGLVETARKVNEVALGIAEIGDQAKRAGVSTKVFQEWAHVARQNRIGVDELIDGLKELNLRADEFVITGKGSAAEAFARLGYSAEELKTKLADPSALMLEIVGRLGELDRAAQIRIADEIFGGTAGERFVELIDQGEDGLRRTIDRANELGLVMSDDLIGKADEINRRFNEISNTVGMTLKSAIVSAADSLADFLDGFRSFENQRNESLQNRVNEIIREKVETNQRLTDARSGNLPERSKNRVVAQMNQRMRELDDEENQIIGVLQDRTEATWRPSNRTWTPPASGTGTGSGAAGGGKGGSSRSVDDFARAVASIKDETAALQAEALAMVAAAAAGDDYSLAVAIARKEAELLNAAQREGKQITPELRAEIEALARGYGMATEATAEAEGAQDRLRAAQDDVKTAFDGAFTGLITGAHSFHDALGQILDRLAEMAASKLFEMVLGGSMGDGVTDFLGKIIGFSNGGYTGAGRKHQVAGVVHAGEYVMPKEVVQRLGVGSLAGLHAAALQGYADGGLVTPLPSLTMPSLAPSTRARHGDQNVTISAPITVNGSAGTPEQNADLARRMAREIEGTMRGVVVDELRRQMRPGNLLKK
ncbi:hypothetical protein [Defluviimonas sp. D31]|uniref:hypothetical protein n=1 Tax=Defluviimonas sp. D31 TaxID=3083253 RepID=UPI00296FFDA6|nr:hypothetical protein [Defluviimonas sp. D31]